MKCETRLRNIVSIAGIVIIIVVAAGCILNGGNSPSTQSPQANTSEKQPSDQIAAERDAYCEIQEFNSTRVRDYTIVPLTDKDLKPYPEFDQYFENENSNAPVWRNDGTRLITYFDCNESTAIRFYSLSRKYEEFPNQPVFEYNGHYYEVSFNSYIWHSRTATPTSVATTGDTSSNQNTGSITR